MSMTVKNRKQPDDAHCRSRRFDFKRHDGTQRHNGKGYARLDKGNFDPGDTERAADSHDTDKGQGHAVKRSSPQLPAEDTDHHHREKVIEAGNRMPKPMDKPARVPDR